MSEAPQIEPLVASVNIVGPTTQKKLLRSYPEAANYLPKKFANDQAIAKMDFAVLRYTQTASMTPHAIQ